MTAQTPPPALTCDVLVVGSGAGGLSAAIVAKKHGLDVLVVEKEEYFGGTTAFSGGVLWIPGNHLARAAGVQDSREAARTYLQNETGAFFDERAVDALLEHGPEMLEFFSSAKPRSGSSRPSIPTITRRCPAASISAARCWRRPTISAGSARTWRVCVRPWRPSPSSA
ncbi:FAD-dependent oxidoreductase [Azotobacter vinelandii]